MIELEQGNLMKILTEGSLEECLTNLVFQEKGMILMQQYSVEEVEDQVLQESKLNNIMEEKI